MFKSRIRLLFETVFLMVWTLWTLCTLYFIAYHAIIIPSNKQISETQIMPQQDKLNPKPNTESSTYQHPEVMNGWVHLINELIKFEDFNTAENEITKAYPQMSREQQHHVTILLATDWNHADIDIPRSFLIKHISYK